MSRLYCETKAVSVLVTIFFCSLLTTASAQPVKLPHGGESLNNVDLPGSDIDHITLDAPTGEMLDLRKEACAKACSDNKDCVAWTYVYPNTIQGPKGNCWLKNSIPAKNNNNCCSSGTVGDANIDRPGSDYKHFDNVNGTEVTPNLCFKACYDEAECKAWTFVKPNTMQGPKGVCWLKNSVPTPVNNPACISGWFDIQGIK